MIGLVTAIALPKVLSAMGFGPKPPVFVFEKSLAPGWVSEGSANPQDSAKGQYERSQIKKFPVASIAVLQQESAESKGCFVAYSYYDFPEDTTRLQENIEKQTEADESLTVIKLDSYKTKMDTPEGSKELTLSQYDLQGAEGEKMLRGAAFGYVDLSKSYIEVRAYCDTAEDLSILTLPLGIGAVKLSSQDRT